jgi:prepilin-type N-terminal cleavage/methylation domain-containing protein
MRRKARSQDGFTLVEVLMGVTMMAVGIAATVQVYGSSGRTVLASQRAAIATQQGQKEIDRLGKLAYNQIGLTSTPASSADPLDPGSRVSGTTFTVRTGLTEGFVLSTQAGQSAAAVSPAPTPFAVGISDATVAGKVYRYVTWRDENCPAGVCDGSQNTKRITVAVTLDATADQPARAPIFVSQVIPDPAAIAPGSSPPPTAAGGSSATAQDFYLYDTRCGSDVRQAQSGDHATHDTASYGPPTSGYSVCENTAAGGALQPDLMGTAVPPGNKSTPLYTQSSDLPGNYDYGLAMKRQGTACRSNFAVGDTLNSSKPNMWSVHGWNTPKFTSSFTLSGKATVSIFTMTVGGASGRGVVCATLLDRVVSGGVPTDTVLGSTTYDLASWPADLRRISFSFDVPSTTIAVNHRLVLTLNVRSESAADLVFVYDHPLYPSFLEVATTTPL